MQVYLEEEDLVLHSLCARGSTAIYRPFSGSEQRIEHLLQKTTVLESGQGRREAHVLARITAPVLGRRSHKTEYQCANVRWRREEKEQYKVVKTSVLRRCHQSTWVWEGGTLSKDCDPAIGTT